MQPCFLQNHPLNRQLLKPDTYQFTTPPGRKLQGQVLDFDTWI